MPTQRLNLGYTPRAQFKAFHKRKQRWACIVAHRRAGKSVACIMDLIDAALRCKKPNARFGYIAPTYTQAKDVVWNYLKEFTHEIPGAELRESDLSVIFPTGARVRLYGSDNQDRLRGIYFDGVVMDEFADMAPGVWSHVVRPALTDRQGWATFIGTPKGRNGFWEIYSNACADPAWFTLALKASQTGLIDEEELETARRDMTPEAYSQEFECSFDAAILGAYFAKEIEAAEAAGRIGAVPYDPILPVHTAWDLGIGDSTAVWFFQVSLREVRVIDHYEASGHGLPHYAAVLAAKPYKYGTDYLPHDAEARQLGTGRSIWETLNSLTGRIPRVLAAQNVMDSINAARITLASAWFDADKCHAGLEALRAYRTDYDERRKVFNDRPRHDWSSHSCLTGDAMILTDCGLRRLDKMKAGDRVWTPTGHANVTWAGEVKRADRLIEIELSDGRQLNCTPEHKILTNRGFLPADALRYSDTIFSGFEDQCRLISSISRATGTGYRATITGETPGTSQGLVASIGLSGSMLMARYLTGMKSTMPMAIRSTMSLPILSVLPVPAIGGNTHYNSLQTGDFSLHHSGHWSLPPSGMHRQMGTPGTASTARAHGIPAGGLSAYARTAVSHLCRRILSRQNGATSIARWRTYEPDAGVQSVFDLTVENHACYQANGFLVSNSDAFRYLSLAWREMQPAKPPPPPRDSWDIAFSRANSEDVDAWRVA